MTYEAHEYSIEDGAPIELYQFVSIGGALEFYYTNNESAITFGGKVYEPVHIARGVIDTSAIIVEPVTVDFTVPRSEDIGVWYGMPFAPPTLRVRVWRKHEGDNNYKKLFVGTSDDFSVKGDWFTIKTKPLIQSKVHRVMCANTYGNKCNHDLFDNRCKLERDDFTWSTTVVDINGQLITVGNDHNPDGGLRFGDLIINGEYRMIIDNVANVIKVRYPLTLVEIGDPVTLVMGCNKTPGACKDFDNYVNFGGFPLTPKNNPVKTATKPGIFTDIRPMPTR